MNNKFWVFIIICLLMFSSAYGSNANALNYSVEFLSACASDILIGIPTGLFVTNMTYGSTEDIFHDVGPGMTFFYSAYFAGGFVGAPLGTVLSGKIMHKNGSVIGAFTGGFAGMGLGILALAGGDKISEDIARASFLLLPPLCSVIGYNLFPHKNDSQSNIFSKNLPAIGLSVLPEKHVDKISPKIGANITFKF